MAEAKKTIENELTCSICLEFFEDPITLQCMHTFCRNCLKRVSESNSGSLMCPLCKTKVNLGRNQTINNLPKNCQVANLVTAFENLNATHPDAPVRASTISLREAAAPSTQLGFIPPSTPVNPTSIINPSHELNAQSSSLFGQPGATNTSTNQNSPFSGASAPFEATANRSTYQNLVNTRTSANQQPTRSLEPVVTEEDNDYSWVEPYEQFLSNMRAEGQGGVSHNVTCGACGRGVYGVRYNCRGCVNFDLCSQCEAAGRHAVDHDMVKVVNPKPVLPRVVFRTENSLFTSATIKCDVCTQKISGVRYRCCECNDFDLCKSCERKNAHPTHDMRKVVNPKLFRNNVPTVEEANGMRNSGKIHPRVTCDVCKCAVRGIRYKCAVCENFDLCAKCLVREKHPEHDMRRIDL